METPSRQRIHYIHRISYTAQERLVGLFVLLAILAVVALFIVNSRTVGLFETRVEYNAYLRNAQGISTDTQVMISGIEVGRVSALGITPDNRIHLTFKIRERFSDLVRIDSRGSLNKLSLLGRASLEITAGDPLLSELPPGSTIPVEEPVSVDEVIAALAPVVEKLESALENAVEIINAIEPADIGRFTSDLTATMAELRRITEQVGSGEGLVGKALYSQEWPERLDASLGALERGVAAAEERLHELKPLLESFARVAGDGERTAAEMPELVQQMQHLLNQISLMMVTVNQEAQHFPELVNRMMILMDETERTLRGVQSIWPLSRTMKSQEEKLLIEVEPLP